jgi:Tfp pilus assembly protein PilN
VPNINLIASRREERKRLETLSRHLLFSVAIAFGLGVAVWSFLAVRTFALRGDLAETNTEIVKLQPAVDKIEYYRTQTTKLRPKIDCLEKARVRTLYWRDLTESLGHSMSQDTWLTAIDIQDRTDAQAGRVREMVLKGVSFTQGRVGVMMMRVNRSPYFEGVRLNYTREGNINGEPMLDFEVMCRLPESGEEGRAKGAEIAKAPAYTKPFPRGGQND